jgi:hypothetical protein
MTPIGLLNNSIQQITYALLLIQIVSGAIGYGFNLVLPPNTAFLRNNTTTVSPEKILRRVS